MKNLIRAMLQRFDRVRRTLNAMRVTSDLGLDVVLTFPKPAYFIYRDGFYWFLPALFLFREDI